MIYDLSYHDLIHYNLTTMIEATMI